MENLFDLTGKVILVTGGSRGLGEQMVRDFSEQGADVVIASRDYEKCVSLSDELKGMGRKALPIRCDVRNIEDIQEMFRQTLENFGKIDIVVNNAGVNTSKAALEVTEKDYDFIFDVNIKGLFFCSQEAAKYMEKQGHGKIINLASVGGIKPLKRIALYTASKAAVIHLTKSLAAEWARYGIHVNAIAPGFIATEINEEERNDEELMGKMLKKISFRKFGNPKDVSSLALYLASKQAEYITGQTFVVDGGFTIE